MPPDREQIARRVTAKTRGYWHEFRVISLSRQRSPAVGRWLGHRSMSVTRPAGCAAMTRRRDPDLVSQYACCLCGEQITWGALLRLVIRQPGQPDYMRQESYSHFQCLRQALRPQVPLTLSRHWNGRQPMPDDRADIADRPCGICGERIAPDAITHVRVQQLAGPVKAPEFREESVPLHFACLAGASQG